MAKFGSDQVAFFLIDGLDIKGVMTSFDEESEAILQESHGLGVGWPETVGVGVRKASLSQDGFFDDAAGSVNDALSELQQTSRVICYAVAGNTIGKAFTGLAGAFGAKYRRGARRDELHRAAADYTVSGQKDEGLILHALGAEGADGDTESSSVDGSLTGTLIPITSSSVANPSVITTPNPHGLTTGDTVVIAGHAGSTPDINGEETVTVTSPTTFTIPVNVTVGGTGGTCIQAGTVSGGAGYLQVTAITLGGYTDVVFKERHSADDISYADLDTFTAVTAVGAQRRAVAGTVNRYLAMSWAWTGAGSGQSVTFALGFARTRA